MRRCPPEPTPSGSIRLTSWPTSSTSGDLREVPLLEQVHSPPHVVMTLVPPDLDQPVFRTADKTVVLKLLPWRNAMGERNESERQGFSEAERTELTIVSGGSNITARRPVTR